MSRFYLAAALLFPTGSALLQGGALLRRAPLRSVVSKGARSAEEIMSGPRSGADISPPSGESLENIAAQWVQNAANGMPLATFNNSYFKVMGSSAPKIIAAWNTAPRAVFDLRWVFRSAIGFGSISWPRDRGVRKPRMACIQHLTAN